MPVKSMNDLFVDELKDLYSAEKQITKALPKMVKASSSPELKTAFEQHLKETETQIQRLDKVFEMLGKSARGKECAGMKGVLEEGEELMGEAQEGPVRDAALITAGQRVEHYEMAGYGSVRDFAKLLGQDKIASLLEETLSEEKQADKKLNQISANVNSQALQAA